MFRYPNEKGLKSYLKHIQLSSENLQIFWINKLFVSKLVFTAKTLDKQLPKPKQQTTHLKYN